MTERDDRVHDFVNYLRSLVREGKEDRGALADLRSGLRADPGQAPRLHGHVAYYLAEPKWRQERWLREDRWFYVVGAMFGANHRHVPGNTMGKCFRILSDSGSDSIEARFITLLGSHPDDLHSHLYHAVRLLESNKPPVGIDYRQLLRDLINWDRADRRVQNQWARDYYRRPENNEKEEDNVE